LIGVFIDTENIDDPFAEIWNGDNVIVGPRSLKLMSDYSQSDEEGRPPTIS